MRKAVFRPGLGFIHKHVVNKVQLIHQVKWEIDFETDNQYSIVRPSDMSFLTIINHLKNGYFCEEQEYLQNSVVVILALYEYVLI